MLQGMQVCQVCHHSLILFTAPLQTGNSGTEGEHQAILAIRNVFWIIIQRPPAPRIQVLPPTPPTCPWKDTYWLWLSRGTGSGKCQHQTGRAEAQLAASQQSKLTDFG